MQRLSIKIADSDNGYFQGEPPTRPVLLRPPKGGLPGETLEPGQFMLTRVPIYGTKDAGRGLRRKIYRIMHSVGLR